MPTQPMFLLHNQPPTCRHFSLYPQLLAVRELEASELQSQLSEHSQASSAQQAADAAALAAQRAALTAAAGAEEARLRREIQVC